MFTILAVTNKIEGKLKNYEVVGDDLVVRLAILNNKTIDVTLPDIPTSIVETMNRTGLEKIKDSTVDLNKGQITLGHALESDGKSVQKGKQLPSEHRPRLQLGGGQIVG
jgi:hypothetical protein